MNRTIVVIAACVSALSGCALNRRTSAEPAVIRELWTEPADLERRDLFYGVGGAKNAPNPRARFNVTDIKTTGTQPGYDLEEAGTGREWSAKLGVEARIEVTVSRIVWAVGYHQPYTYYVPEWTSVKDGRATVQKAARFRLESAGHKKSGEWSWVDNPFVGSRELAGLFTLMVMVNNWDIKTAQNAVYDVENGGDKTEWFLVRDLGASFGGSKWLTFGSKDDPEGFENEKFIKSTDGNRVEFGYQGSWMVPHLLASITPGDVRWVSGLLARLSDKQWHDAFRAGGFTESEANRYIRRMKEKIAEGVSAGRS